MNSIVLEALEVIRNEGTIIYPTDTIWGIGCDATNEEAVNKVYKLKKRPDSKSLIILVDGMDMLKKHIVTVPETIERFLNTATRPTTVIYNHPRGLASNVIAADDTVAIRIVQNDFCQALIREFGKPIVSTSANFSNEPSPGSFDEINPLLLKQADYIVNLPAIESGKTASQIIKCNDLGEIEFLRK